MDNAAEALEHIVTKSNKLVEASYRLTIAEQRLVALLSSKVAPADEDFKPYTFTVAELGALVGLTGKHLHRQLQEATRALIGRVVTFRDGAKLVQVSWMSSASYEEGTGQVSLCFDPAMRPHFLQLKECFTSYRLKNIVRLRSTYSVRLYELFVQYASKGGRTFGLDELRGLLAVDKGTYKTWQDFQRNVLDTSRTELAEHTDLVFKYQPKKGAHGRVVGVVFEFQFKTAPAHAIKRGAKGAAAKAKAGTAKLQLKAAVCFDRVNGSCAATWVNHSSPDDSCYWCQRFETRRAEIAGQGRLPGMLNEPGTEAAG